MSHHNSSTLSYYGGFEVPGMKLESKRKIDFDSPRSTDHNTLSAEGHLNAKSMRGYDKAFEERLISALTPSSPKIFTYT